MADHARTNTRATSNAIALSLAAVWAGACERTDVANPPPTASIIHEPEARGPRFSFPQELRVDDDSVNAFVERALVEVAGGKYEPYRLLWTVKDEPSSRGDYEQRWHGVSDIRLRALRRIILTNGNGRQTGDPSYALLADFSFDPTDPPFDREPLHDVVWIVVKEQDDPQSGLCPWRLSKPSKAVKQWLREQVAASTPQRTDSDSVLP